MLFPRFIAMARPNVLVMCHPGPSDALLSVRDVMTVARDRELAYLMSERGLRYSRATVSSSAHFAVRSCCAARARFCASLNT